MHRSLFALTAVLALSACSSVEVTPTTSAVYPPTAAHGVQILKNANTTRPFFEIGTVTVVGYDIGDTAAMHDEIRAEAAPLGAHAVILTEEGLISDEWPHDRYAMGMAIRWGVEGGG